MEPTTLPTALRERLGEDASFELLTMFHTTGHAWKDDVVILATERFGRQVTEQVGMLRQEMATMRVEWLKWSFLFWIGQLAAMAALLAFMLRSAGVR